MSLIDDFDRELARCDQELDEMWRQEPTQPAVITALGILDWEREKKLILQAKRESAARLASGVGPS